jgi:hypothetical protein
MQTSHREEHPMMTRLVLVGMVAALGITVPAWSELPGWMKAAHSWTAWQLAEWDRSAPSEVETIMMPPPPVRRVVAFETIVPDDRSSDIADALNRAAEGLNIPPEATIARRQPKHKGNTRVAPERTLAEYSGVPGIDSMEMKLMAELLGAAEPSHGDGQPAESIVTPRRSTAMIPPIVCVFTRSVSPPPAVAIASPPIEAAPGLAETASTPAPVEPVADPTAEIFGTLQCFAEGIDPSQPAETVAALPDCVFEPIDPETTRNASLAAEVNQRAPGGSDRLAQAAPVADDVRTPADVAQALRLTREAVHAWMKVMTRPAIVHVSAR